MLLGLLSFAETPPQQHLTISVGYCWRTEVTGPLCDNPPSSTKRSVRTSNFDIARSKIAPPEGLWNVTWSQPKREIWHLLNPCLLVKVITKKMVHPVFCFVLYVPVFVVVLLVCFFKVKGSCGLCYKAGYFVLSQFPVQSLAPPVHI